MISRETLHKTKKNETSEKNLVKPKRYILNFFCDFRFALPNEPISIAAILRNSYITVYSKVFFLCALWKPSAKLVTRPERHSPTIPNAPVTKVQLNLAVTE